MVRRKKSRWILWGSGIFLVWLAVNALVLGLLTPTTIHRLARQIPLISKNPEAAGFQLRWFQDHDGQSYRYVVYVPPELSARENLPVVLYLNGRGKNGSDGISPLIDGIAPALWEHPDRFPCIVVWPQCPDSDSWHHQTAASKRALSILHQIVAEFRADPDRLYLTGLSSGGYGVWSIASAQPELFAAMAPMSAGGMSREDVDRIIAARLPVWSFCVDNDSPSVVDANRSATEQMVNAGLSPRLTELHADDGGAMDHHDAWSYAYRNSAFHRWLFAQHRKDRPTSPDFVSLSSNVFPDSLVAGDTSHAVGDEIHDLAELHFEFLADEEIDFLSIDRIEGGLNKSESRHTLRIPIGDPHCDNLESASENSLRSSLPALLTHALLQGLWNDLRLSFSADSISVELNGWFLGRHPLPNSGQSHSSIRLQAMGTPGALVRFRYPRLKKESSGASSRKRSSATHFSIAGSERPSVVTLEEIFASWRRQDEIVTPLRLSWQEEADATEIASKQGIHHLEIASTGVNYSTRWRHPEIWLTRSQGLSGERRLVDFQHLLGQRFENSVPTIPSFLQRKLQIQASSWIDELQLPSGHAYRRAEGSPNNLLSHRLGLLDDLRWRAPVMALRPLFLFGSQIAQAEYHLCTDQSGTSGFRSVVIEERYALADPVRNVVRRLWIEPENNFRLQRLEVEINGVVQEDVEYEYEAGSKSSASLKSWRMITRPRPADSVSPRYFPGNQLLLATAIANVIKEAKGTNERGRAKASLGADIVLDCETGKWFQEVSHGRRHPLTNAEASLLLNRYASNRQHNTFIPTWGFLVAVLVNLPILWWIMKKSSILR